jgi:ATPases involved in chromosome partitioning
MSLGFLIPEDAPAIWRGAGGNAGYNPVLKRRRMGRDRLSVVDLPPGTGDIQLTLVQTVPINFRRSRFDPAGYFAYRREESPCDVR